MTVRKTSGMQDPYIQAMEFVNSYQIVIRMLIFHRNTLKNNSTVVEEMNNIRYCEDLGLIYVTKGSLRIEHLF